MNWLKNVFGAKDNSEHNAENQNAHEEVVARLTADRERFYSSMGELSENVVGRVLGNYLEPRLYLWPSSALGKVQLIRRGKNALFVTNGISDPWDYTMHEDKPEDPLQFELAIELPLADFEDDSDEALLGGWVPTLLFAASDPYVEERIDPVGAFHKFGCATIGIPALKVLSNYVGKDGYMLGLAGFPIIEGLTSLSIAELDGYPIFLLMLKLLTPDEIDYALENNFENALELIQRFNRRGDRHLNWRERPSVLKEPMLKNFPG